MEDECVCVARCGVGMADNDFVFLTVVVTAAEVEATDDTLW